MGRGKILSILVLLLVNLITSIGMLFNLEFFMIELIAICGFILVSIIAFHGIFMGRGYGKPLLLLLFSTLLFNQIYLYTFISSVKLFSLAFISALIGFLVSMTIRTHKKQKKISRRVRTRKAAFPTPKIEKKSQATKPKRAAKKKKKASTAKKAKKKQTKKKGSAKKKKKR